MGERSYGRPRWSYGRTGCPYSELLGRNDGVGDLLDRMVSIQYIHQICYTTIE